MKEMLRDIGLIPGLGQSLLNHSKNHYIWEVRSANRWDARKTATPAVRVGQQKGPNSSPRQCPTVCLTTNASKGEWLDHILPHPPYSPDAAKSLQSCPTLCDPIDRSPPGPAIPGILQARVLEWAAIFTWPLANQLPLLQASWQLSIGKMLPQPAEGSKCFPRVHRSLKHRFLHYRNKQTYFSFGRNLLIVMVPISINKDVFEPSCKDLKFMVQNCN